MDLRQKKIYRVTLVGSLVNALLIGVKLFAGIVGRSSAMIADAIHSLTDFISDIIVLVFIKIAGKKQDETHSYGHGKFETFASMVIGLILAVTGVLLLLKGIQSVISSLRGNELPEPTWVALGVAIASIVAKEVLYHYTVRVGKQVNSDAVVANAWHHRSDSISSIGTLIGIGGAMFLGVKWRILDPLAAVVVSFFIIKAAWQIMKPSVNELLEQSLDPATIASITELTLAVPGVRSLHHLRTRKIGNAIVIDVHVKMDGNQSLAKAHNIATEIEHRLKDRFGQNAMIYIHMEPDE